jgi:hypothetical protein
VAEQGQEAYVDHCDLISQALMERILQFTEDSMDTISSSDSQSSGKTQPQPEGGGVESMEEDNGGDGLLTVTDGGGGSLYDGGSGPPSLGSLSLSSSQPTSLGQQPHSLSISTGRSERESGKKRFAYNVIMPLSVIRERENERERGGGREP